MNKEEKIYMFNEYALGYDKGNNDRSCLTISKIISGDMYVMGSLYDGSADVISMIFDNLQQENKRLKEIEKEHQRINGQLRETISKAINRINKGIFIIPKDTNELLDILKEVE